MKAVTVDLWPGGGSGRGLVGTTGRGGCGRATARNPSLISVAARGGLDLSIKSSSSPGSKEFRLSNELDESILKFFGASWVSVIQVKK